MFFYQVYNYSSLQECFINTCNPKVSNIPGQTVHQGSVHMLLCSDYQDSRDVVWQVKCVWALLGWHVRQPKFFLFVYGQIVYQSYSSLPIVQLGRASDEWNYLKSFTILIIGKNRLNSSINHCYKTCVGPDEPNLDGSLISSNISLTLFTENIVDWIIFVWSLFPRNFWNLNLNLNCLLLTCILPNHSPGPPTERISS